MSRDNTGTRHNLRLAAELSWKLPDALWCCWTHRQSPILGFFESAPEVRVLCSAGVTRPRRSYDPVRLPPGPPCLPRRRRRDLRPERVSPDYPNHLACVPCPLPRRTRTGAHVGCFPVPRGLPHLTDGSASATSLSRPAQASLALRPASLLAHPRWTLSQGFDPAGYPTKPLARARFELSESVWGIPFGFGVWLKMLAGDGGQYGWRNIFPRICASG